MMNGTSRLTTASTPSDLVLPWAEGLDCRPVRVDHLGAQPRLNAKKGEKKKRRPTGMPRDLAIRAGSSSIPAGRVSNKHHSTRL